MPLIQWIQITVLIIGMMLLVPFLGKYIAAVFQGEKTFLHPLLKHLESFSYRVSHINPQEEMERRGYLKALLLFNCFGFVFLFFLLLIQNIIPLNPQGFNSVSWPLALNIAISFVTNTNWQTYAGEITLSHATQMVGLTVQNFLSAATGCTALLVLARGLSRKTTTLIGNFWVDLVRSIVYLFLPLSIILAVVLISQGVPQTLSHYVEVETLENRTQVIPVGPVASQVAIKQLGTNGGGFYSTNSAHPFENPTGLSNFLELVSILLIPASLAYAFGVIIGSKKHALLLLLAMVLVWVGGVALSLISDDMNLEGKETRFGVVHSILWSISTTTTANGSVNAMLDSLSPLAGGIALFNLMLGELFFGGIGVGLCSLLMFVLLTVFLGGLMVGRTPEYLGKKIEKREIQLVFIAILVPSALILIGSGLSVLIPAGLESRGNRGPHGLSEILYAFSSCASNNGSAFAGLRSNTLYYNLFLSCAMLLGRVAILVPSVAIGGLLASKKCSPPTLGTFPTNTFLFFSLLLGVILIVESLTFFPALSLGPLVEHFLLLRGETF